MLIIPAIDIKGGKVVRLFQGNFTFVTSYADDPVAMARTWVGKGAERLHVVDLDGARLGALEQFDTIARIAQSVAVPIQAGGGIRTPDDIARLLEAGVAKVILSTKAIDDRKFLKEILQKWPEDIIISLDCREDKVARHGWTVSTDIQATTFARELQDMGVQCLIYTDISRDGMLSGPNLDSIRMMLKAVTIPIIASGGISQLGDIQSLLALSPQGLFGCITGRALYEGTLDLREAINLCKK